MAVAAKDGNHPGWDNHIHALEEHFRVLEDSLQRPETKRTHAVHLLRGYQALLCAAESSHTGRTATDKLVAIFAQLRALRHLLPLKTCQLEKFWLNTVVALERLGSMKPALKLARELVQKMRSVVDACPPANGNQDDACTAMELLSHACIRLSSLWGQAWASLQNSNESLTMDSAELLDLVDLLESRVLTWIAQPSPSRKSQAVLPSMVWKSLLRCAATLPVSSTEDQHLHGWRSVLRALPAALDSSGSLIKAVMAVMEELRRSSLTLKSQNVLLTELWQCRSLVGCSPVSSLASEDAVWARVVEEAVRTGMSVSRSGSNEACKGELLIKEALDALGPAQAPWRVNLCFLLVQLRIAGLPLGVKPSSFVANAGNTADVSSAGADIATIPGSGACGALLVGEAAPAIRTSTREKEAAVVELDAMSTMCAHQVASAAHEAAKEIAALRPVCGAVAGKLEREVERLRHAMGAKGFQRMDQQLLISIPSDVTASARDCLVAWSSMCCELGELFFQSALTISEGGLSECSTSSKRCFRESPIPAAIKQCASPVRKTARQTQRAQEPAVKEGGCSAHLLAASCDLLCRSAPWAPLQHIVDHTMPKLKQVMRIFLETRTKPNVPKELIGFLKYLAYYSAKRGDNHAAVGCLLQAILECVLQSVPWKALAEEGVLSQLSQSMFAVMRVPDTTIMCWAAQFLWQASRSLPDSGVVDGMQAVLNAIKSPYVATKVALLKKVLQECSEVHKLSAADVLASSQDWLSDHFQMLASAISNCECEGQVLSLPASLERFYAMLKSHSPQDAVGQLEGPRAQSWCAMLDHLELKALEHQRFGLAPGKSIPRDSILSGFLILREVALYSRLLTGASVMDVRQHAGHACACARLVLELTRNGNLGCTSDYDHECTGHLPLKAVLDMLERATSMLYTSGNTYAAELGRLCVKQAEVASVLRRPAEAASAAARYAVEALKSWRTYLSFEDLDGDLSANVVRLRMVARIARPTSCECLLPDLLEAVHLFELLGLMVQAAEALILGLAAASGSEGPALTLQLQYRLACALARASVSSVHMGPGLDVTGARRAAFRTAAETWWEAAEADHSCLIAKADPNDSGLILGLDAFRVEAAAALLHTSSNCVAEPSLQPNLLRLCASSGRGLAAVEALQVSAEWSAQSLSNWNGQHCREPGGVVALRLATQAYEGVKQLVHRSASDRHLTGSTAASSVQGWSHSRFVLLQLRNFHLLGLCYERIGMPQWADYFYSAGWRFLTQHSCGAADWQLRFLCARARLASSGFPCRVLQGMHGCDNLGDRAAKSETLCKSADEAVSDLQTFWNAHLPRDSRLVLRFTEMAQDHTNSELLPQRLEELDLPLDLAEFWAFFEFRRCQLMGPYTSTMTDDWQEWANRRPYCDKMDGVPAEATIGAEVTRAQNFNIEMTFRRSMGQIAHILRSCSETSTWTVCALHVASGISLDLKVPLHSSICLELLCIAELCAQELTSAIQDSLDHIAAKHMVQTFHICVDLLKQGFKCEGEWRHIVRDALWSLDATSANGGKQCTPVVQKFRTALILGIAALQTGMQSGHSSIARCAAQHVVALSFDVAERVAQVQALHAAETKENHKPIVQNRRRSRSQPKPRADLADSRDLALSVCAGTLPLCSGMSVFLLHELRSQQRGQEQPGGSSSSQTPTCRLPVSDADCQKSSLLSKFYDGGWLNEIPEDVAVAWLQLDRSAQVLQIARRVDGPNSNMARRASPLALWRVPLRQSAFERLEEELLDLQRDHHSEVTSFEDSNMESKLRKQSSQREFFWHRRNHFDSSIQLLAKKFQDEIMKEWRFLLKPWPSDQDVNSISTSFEDWLASAGNKDTWLPQSEVHCWMLSLLYWAADEMQTSEVSSVLAALLQSAGLHKREVERLAVTLHRHRLAAWQSPGQGASVLGASRAPLLLFLDSAIAQFPVEACPTLWQREVVRAVAPNVALAAFQRLRGRSLAKQQTLLRRGQSAVCGQSDGTVPRLAPQCGHYILDLPRDDLNAEQGKLKLQELLEEWALRRKCGVWQGSIGEPLPHPNEVLKRMGTQDVLVCMGHGRTVRSLLNKDPVAVQRGSLLEADPNTHVATVPLPPKLSELAKSTTSPRCLRRFPLKAVSLLMGCSTARVFRPEALALQAHVELHRPAGHGAPRSLFFNAEFESFGMPLDILVGGGPAVVGTLWDVLAGDLDLLTSALLERWVAGASMASSPASHSLVRKRDLTGKHLATGQIGLAGALVHAREACRLKFLTGAAVVCYGIPL